MTPLAEQLRPRGLEEVVGQIHLVGPHGFLTQIIEQGRPLSIILWGPPGCGKTSIARLYAKTFNKRFVSLSAVWDGIAELKRVIKEMTETPLLGQGIVIFVDEIHRFNRAQQDTFLPFIENGTVILIGATAENPSFALVHALLSRVRVLECHSLSPEDLHLLLQRAEAVVGPLNLAQEARDYLVHLSQGDGRFVINLVENMRGLKKDTPLTIEDLQHVVQKRAALFDRAGDQHYNLISALHKAVRGSDPDAALYWYTRILEGGEEPLFLARRIVRMASEDIGLADPHALPLALAARETYEALGSPEGELALAEAIVYLALAPKSNALYTAYKQARALAASTGHLPPPKIILNAPTKLMKEKGYDARYKYDHDEEEAFSGQNYFPDTLERSSFYHPVERGFEREMVKRLAYFAQLRAQKSDPSPS